jgi:hypothetical protein
LIFAITFSTGQLTLPEDLPEVFRERGPLLQLGRIIWPPFPLQAQHTPIFKAKERKALSRFQIHHSALVLVDRNAEFCELLAYPPVYRLHQPVIPPFSVYQYHQVVRKTCILEVVDLPLRVTSTALSSIRSTSFR